MPAASYAVRATQGRIGLLSGKRSGQVRFRGPAPSVNWKTDSGVGRRAALPVVGYRPDVGNFGRRRSNCGNGDRRRQQGNIRRRNEVSGVEDFLAQRAIGGVFVRWARPLSVRKPGLTVICNFRSFAKSRRERRREVNMCLGDEALEREGGNGEDKRNPRPHAGRGAGYFPV